LNNIPDYFESCVTNFSICGFHQVLGQVILSYQSETKSHISYCVAAKSHSVHMGTHEHHPISSLTHINLLS